MTQNCFHSIRMVVSGPRRSENQRSSRAGVLGRDSCQTVHLPKPDMRFVYVLKYPYSYFLNIEYTLSDNMSIVFYQKGYIFIVTVYILWYSKAKEMNA